MTNSENYIRYCTALWQTTGVAKFMMTERGDRALFYRYIFQASQEEDGMAFRNIRAPTSARDLDSATIKRKEIS